MKVARSFLFTGLIGIGVLIGFGYGRWYGPRETAEIASQETKPGGYFCPMHPAVRSDKAGDCPICGMRLVPEPAASQPPAPSPDPAPLPRGTIRVSPAKQQLIGVKYGVVEVTSGVHTFRALGRVAIDETRVSKVQTRIDGWIEKVYADFVGKPVEKGQPLLTFYSPEMLASQQEYLLAIRSREVMKGSPLAGSIRQSESLLAAARKRLEFWELSDAQIEEITRTGQPLPNVTLYAPISGFVMARNAFPKQRITPETELYTIADLSRVWIVAEVFENEASMIRPGVPARVFLSHSESRAIVGSVEYIQPQLEAATHTLKVRIGADNRDMLLKPEMFAHVELQVSRPPQVTVPSEAVLDTGLRKTVFVDRGNGYLEPRQVETGDRIGDRISITSGLKPGERVVTSGNFLIDSESQLKAAAAGMAGQTPDAKPTAPREHKHD